MRRTGRARTKKRRRLLFGALLLLALLIAASDMVPPATFAFRGGERPRSDPAVPFGAFLGSGQDGVTQIDAFDAWLAQGDPGGSAAPRMTVGHTYLPGDSWSSVAGDPQVLDPWTAWHRANPGSLLVVNVPLAAPNEAPTGDDQVRTLLRQGASGAYDSVFRTLAERLVSLGSGDAILVPAWEMNGVTYADRCAPDPAAWKAYWQRVVTVIRSVPGARFRFDFDPDRGVDDIPWPQCYPGDAYVDIIGMDSYDQPPGRSFGDFVTQPYGLAAQVAFAAQHHKPVSYPEWGLYRYGDDAAFVSAMLAWISTQDTVYETITDYCPHGVFECRANPESSNAYRSAVAHR